MKRKQKQDPVFGKDVLETIDNAAKAKLAPIIRLRDTPKFLKASPELQWEMRKAAHQRKLRYLHEIRNPEPED